MSDLKAGPVLDFVLKEIAPSIYNLAIGHAEYGRNVQAILRGDGVEGRWFRASREWLHAVEPLLRQ